MLSGSELASRYCPILRDVYLKRVVRAVPPLNVKMARGIAYHFIVHSALDDVKRLLYSRFDYAGSSMLEEPFPSSNGAASKAVEKAKSALGFKLFSNPTISTAT